MLKLAERDFKSLIIIIKSVSRTNCGEDVCWSKSPVQLVLDRIEYWKHESREDQIQNSVEGLVEVYTNLDNKGELHKLSDLIIFSVGESLDI